MILTVGTFIIMDKDFTEEAEKYKSRVVDSGEDFVMIDYPTHIETGRTAFFMDGTQLLVSFTSELKLSYAFRTEVIGRMNKGIPMLKLSYPGDDQLVKVQRREFVRVEAPVDVAVMKEHVKAQLVAEDISAGGIALNLPDRTIFEEQEIVDLLIVLPFMNSETKYVQVKGEIVRIWEKSQRTIASVQFEGIREDDRQRIVRYCFERQLQMRNA